ncbi:two-component system response regulator [Anaerobacillus alkalidiazotrophicus]|uniref:Two-component system response regulator n=1 Tax=Anaerobacillus alkalidiazotrophicus TaxID=472963 RepID=A0A1S2MA58_9BACI|nr:response regulator [Anaerobacillus alkalidiazotrophicus]OIJ21569.1 two-component system response regulator [Anaerobacillus alkalidiazotrophicus]
MNVLITDDEVQIRKGLRMKVDWEKEGFQIVGEASNGQEALEKIKVTDVDIVITDVRMPIMDGIEFVKRCNLEHPHIKVIVLSGYSDFEYVRSSLIEGVKDYLLKPVAPDELVDVLRRIKREGKEEKKKQIESERMSRVFHNQLEEIREQYLLHLVKEDWSEPTIAIERLYQLQLEAFANENVEVQFVTVEMRTSNRNRMNLKELWLPFRMMCRELAEGYEGTYSFYDASYANIIHFIHRVDLEPLKQNSSFIQTVQRQVKELINVETVIGIGKVVTGLKEFKSGFISALLSWSQSQLGSQSQVIDGTFSKEMFEYSPDFEKRLINAIENMNHDAFKTNIYSLLGGTNNQSIMTFSFSSNRVLFLLGSLARKYDLDTNDINNTIWNCQQSIWELNSQNRVIEQLIHLAQSIIERVNEARCSSNGAMIVENVRRYLEKHYASEISLTTLAEQFHINSAYLSEIFKNHVGQNFSDYLIKLRMDKAQHFLKDQQLKIIDVAHLVGFSNSGYFSTVFKKQFGKTPVEYRKSLNFSQ